MGRARGSRSGGDNTFLAATDAQSWMVLFGALFGMSVGLYLFCLLCRNVGSECDQDMP